VAGSICLLIPPEVFISNSTVTEVGGTVTFSTTVHDNSVISQVVGRVGIGTDNPTQTLTVAGSANVQSLIVTGDATFDANTIYSCYRTIQLVL
jgi:hypothetical protein